MHNDDKLDQEYYILNENNKYITREFIEKQLNKFEMDYKINDIGLFQNAMVHMSYLIRDENFYKNSKTKLYQIQSTDIEPISEENKRKSIPLQKKSYERLEFVGDAVIHLILADYLFQRYNEDEGFMTRLRTKIENSDTLAQFSRIMGLQEYVIISRYVEKNGGRDTNDNILEDAFEAFTGSLFIDGGFEVCRQFITYFIEKELDMAKLLYVETNFKNRLLQYFHTKRWEDPIYGQLDVSGPENKKIFTMYVKCKKIPQDEGEIVGIGVGSSKKKGEQESAKQAMVHFGQYNDEESDSDSDSYECIDGS